jgi:hypothetical protein
VSHLKSWARSRASIRFWLLSGTKMQAPHSPFVVDDPAGKTRLLSMKVKSVSKDVQGTRLRGSCFHAAIGGKASNVTDPDQKLSWNAGTTQKEWIILELYVPAASRHYCLRWPFLLAMSPLCLQAFESSTSQ